MGGNAFPHLNLVRVKREDVLPTVQYVVDTLALPGFTYEYAAANLMGSAGKQDDSGDLDFALNNKPPRFVGEPDLPVFKLSEFAARCREVLPKGHVDTKTMRGGQFQSAWPVAGDDKKGKVQVDFVAGDPNWLKFTHYSPGKDRSPWKGVAISTMLGVLAKMYKDFEAFSDGTFCVGDDCRGTFMSTSDTQHKERVARVGLHYDLEKGLYRKWQLQLRPNQGITEVSADYFETHMQLAPRFTRLNYLAEPEAVLELLLGQRVALEDVDTFEKLVKQVKTYHPDRFDEAKERFAEAFMRSAGRNEYSLEDVLSSPVWLVE